MTKHVTVDESTDVLPLSSLRRDQLLLDFHTHGEHSMTEDAQLRKEIEEIWNKLVSRNAKLYNGSKFRYVNCTSEGNRAVLKVGITSYKDLCGTNLSLNNQTWAELGRKRHGNSQAYMADPLGVGVLLLTSDLHLVLLRRSCWTPENPGVLDRPGGHPEPNRIFSARGEGWSLLDGLGSDVTEAISQEVWNSVTAEARDEVGIALSDIHDLCLVGLSFNKAAAQRPALEFFARVHLSSSEVDSVYKKGTHLEADESQGIEYWGPSMIREILSEITAPATDGDNWQEKEVHGGSCSTTNEGFISSNLRELQRETTASLKGALWLAKDILLDLLK